jgi:two-component system C4-dicarboxylate transport sensor histidine kinase DctB
MLRRRATFWAASAPLLAAGMFMADELAARRTEAELAHTAKVSATLHAAVLRSEPAKHRSLPYVLAQERTGAGRLALTLLRICRLSGCRRGS